jgi:hypothetical protein
MKDRGTPPLKPSGRKLSFLHLRAIAATSVRGVRLRPQGDLLDCFAVDFELSLGVLAGMDGGNTVTAGRQRNLHPFRDRPIVEDDAVIIQGDDAYPGARLAEADAPQRQRAEADRHRQHNDLPGADNRLSRALGVADPGTQPLHAGRDQEGGAAADGLDAGRLVAVRRGRRPPFEAGAGIDLMARGRCPHVTDQPAGIEHHLDPARPGARHRDRDRASVEQRGFDRDDVLASGQVEEAAEGVAIGGHHVVAAAKQDARIAGHRVANGA